MHFYSRSFQIAFAIVAYVFLAPFLPVEFSRVLYTLSLTIKDLLMWVIPCTAFFFIVSSVSSFKKKAPFFLSLLLSFEAISNFVSLWFAFIAGTVCLLWIPSFEFLEFQKGACEPFFRFFNIRPSWWSADKGALIGMVVGTVCGYYQNERCCSFFEKGKLLSQKILTKGFSKIVPLFVVGLIANIHVAKSFSKLIFQSSWLVCQLCLILIFYLILLFLIASRGSFNQCKEMILALLPAGSLAFLSGCSLSTMPWTIKGCEKILKTPSLATNIIPATTNIQQIGDCITNSFLCFLIYSAAFGHPPSLTTWLTFSLVFTFARFATAAVLGGAIFLVLPIYEKYLHFNPEMIALILALNIFFDPLVTSSNVMANGALCKVFENIWDLFEPTIAKVRRVLRGSFREEKEES